MKVFQSTFNSSQIVAKFAVITNSVITDFESRRGEKNTTFDILYENSLQFKKFELPFKIIV